MQTASSATPATTIARRLSAWKIGENLSRITGLTFVSWWCRDVWSSAKLYRPFYFYRVGAFLRALGDRLPEKDRVHNSTTGTLKLRLPVSLLLCLLIALAVHPAVFCLTVKGPWRLQGTYLGAYIQSGIAGAKTANGQPSSITANVVAKMEPGGLTLATSDVHPGYAKMPVEIRDVPAFHSWLQRVIYRGGVWPTYQRFIYIQGAILLLLPLIGSTMDGRRRIRAQNGVYRLGTRMVSVKKWTGRVWEVD